MTPALSPDNRRDEPAEVQPAGLAIVSLVTGRLLEDAPMPLIEQMRQELVRARSNGRNPDHWEVTPESLARIKDEARPGDLVGAEFSGEWALDGVALKETTVPGDKGILLVTIGS